MAFATHEQCAELLDEIWRLIPEDKRWPVIDRSRDRNVSLRVLGSEGGSAPRYGEHHQGRSAQVVFDSRRPRSWSARVQESYERVMVTKKETKVLETVAKVAIARIDPRFEWGRFGTYGLNVYNARPDYAWETIDWSVRQTATNGQLGLFTTSPQFVSGFGRESRRVQVAIDEGHVAFDEVEARALLDVPEFKGFLMSREEHAVCNSFRVTPAGLIMLHEVIAATAEMEQEFAADSWPK